MENGLLSAGKLGGITQMSGDHALLSLHVHDYRLPLIFTVATYAHCLV